MTSRDWSEALAAGRVGLSAGARCVGWQTGVEVACSEVHWKTAKDARKCSRSLGAGWGSLPTQCLCPSPSAVTLRARGGRLARPLQSPRPRLPARVHERAVGQRSPAFSAIRSASFSRKASRPPSRPTLKAQHYLTYPTHCIYCQSLRLCPLLTRPHHPHAHPPTDDPFRITRAPHPSCSRRQAAARRTEGADLRLFCCAEIVCV